MPDFLSNFCVMYFRIFFCCVCNTCTSIHSLPTHRQGSLCSAHEWPRGCPWLPPLPCRPGGWQCPTAPSLTQPSPGGGHEPATSVIKKIETLCIGRPSSYTHSSPFLYRLYLWLPGEFRNTYVICLEPLCTHVNIIGLVAR